MSFPQLETQRLFLRQFGPEDLEAVFKGLSHPEVIRYYGISFDSLPATQAQLDWYADLEANKKGMYWAICDKESQELVGAGGFNDWSHEHRKAEVGFWLLRECWGKGFMQEAMPTILGAGFDHLKLHRIEGFVDPENVNCKRALDKIGFAYEGTMRDCEVKDGRFISLDIYAMFNPVD